MASSQVILVTGASGFIGRHCLEELKASPFQVVALGKAKGQIAGFPVQELNLFDSSAVASFLKKHRPTHLLHLAWEATPGTYWTSPLNREWITASLALYQAFVENGGRRAVFAGSSAEYEWSSEGGVFSERKTPRKPATLYGQCKLELYDKIGELKASEFAWARLFYLYGKNEASGRLVSSAFQSILRNEPFLTTDGMQIRDYMYVEEAASALVTLANSNLQGAINVGSGQRTRVKEILAEIAAITGKGSFIQLGKIPQRPNDPTEIVADVTRLHEELKWKPKRSLHEGLAETWAWWQEQAQLSR